MAACDSGMGYPAHAAPHSETVSRAPPESAGRCRGGRGPRISTASPLVTVRSAALKRPQVLTPFSGAIHGA